MASKVQPAIGKVLYGAAFVAVLPALLIVWARATEKSVPIPVIESMPVGLIIGILGASIMAAGMGAIWFYGHGLPMNAYPPARFVTEGIYRFIPHPIYIGFSILCFGAAIALGSASGLWLVSPAAVIGCVALVQGYEKQATLDHFGPFEAEPFIHFPTDQESSPKTSDRISFYVIGIIPWLIFLLATGVIADAAIANSPPAPESTLPIFQSAEQIYLSRFFLIMLAPLMVRSSRGLRLFLIYGSVATGISGLLFSLFPCPIKMRPFDSHGFTGLLMAWDSSGLSLFSLSSQVAWTLLAAATVSRGNRYRWILFFPWAMLAIGSGLFAGTQTIFSVGVGITLFAFAVNIRKIWEFARSVTERIANSRTEWRFGPIRVINHGFYAAGEAFISLAIAGSLVGRDLVPQLMMITLLAIVISSLSAQWIEGSPVLLRPYGWYGGVVGAILGVSIVYLIGGDVWLLAGAFCVGAPWVQAAGRLRCLVQGCCHGREAPPEIGIRYVHPMSRVCKLSKLGGVPLHPTQLYSILCNLVVALIVGRLWLSGASLALIVGIYLILTGFGRFVEESLRGEPQTPKFAGLRLYQLFAVLSVICGIGITMIGNIGAAPAPRFNWEAIAASACFSAFVFLAFGVDLPNSNRRFTRLT